MRSKGWRMTAAGYSKNLAESRYHSELLVEVGQKLDSGCSQVYCLCMSVAVEAPKRVWTEAELQALPEDGCNHELVNGELTMSPKNDFPHGDICSRLVAAFVNYNPRQKFGVILDSSTGFWMKNRNCGRPTSHS